MLNSMYCCFSSKPLGSIYNLNYIQCINMTADLSRILEKQFLKCSYQCLMFSL